MGLPRTSYFRRISTIGCFVMLLLSTACHQPTGDALGVDAQASLPFGLRLEPNPGFQGGYTIREADGFALVGKGVTYRDIDLQITDLLGYGVQDAALAAEVLDAHGNHQYIKVVQRGAPSQPPFQVSWATAAEVKHSGSYEWVDLPHPDSP